MLPTALGCGRKGDPIPRTRATPGICQVRWATLRKVEIRLPLKDSRNEDLIGIERVRVYYLPMGSTRPLPQEVATKGELLLEQRRPDLPGPGELLTMDLKQVSRSSGWIVVTAVRVGNILGEPSEVLPWLDPAY